MARWVTVRPGEVSWLDLYNDLKAKFKKVERDHYGVDVLSGHKKVMSYLRKKGWVVEWRWNPRLGQNEIYVKGRGRKVIKKGKRRKRVNNKRGVLFGLDL